MKKKKPLILDKDRRFVPKLARTSSSPDGSIDLSMRRVYILPTQKGVYYLITVIIMFIWTVNYGLSLGYAMTFFAAVFAQILTVLTVGNLSNLRVNSMENSNFFANEPAYFRFSIKNLSNQPKVNIQARRNGENSKPVSVYPLNTQECHVPLHDVSRGKKQLDFLRVYSDYPMGIFSSWAWLKFDNYLLIYPAPEGDLPLPFLPDEHNTDEGVADQSGNENFHDMRDYQPGDNLRHVMWKKMVNDKVHVKIFQDLAGKECILDFSNPLLSDMDTEEKLSQLCQWVIDAENNGIRYALNLPTQKIKLDSGPIHQTRCLEALACY